MQITDEKLVELFGTWSVHMRPIVESKEWDALYRMLKERTQQKQVVIPRSVDVWKSWRLCDRQKVKCVVIGQDPYPSMKGETMIANGVPFDCSNTGMLQPSLWSIWEKLEEKGFDPDMWQMADISWWLTQEHVMLINSCGTTEKDRPGCHWPYWEPIMKMFIEVLNTNYRGLPICLLGEQAKKLEKWIDPLVHRIYTCEHPVMAGRFNRKWNTNMFEWVNDIIEANNGPEYRIRWTRKKGESLTAPTLEDCPF